MSTSQPSIDLQGLIPNFCQWRSLLTLMVLMELVAVVLTLAGPADASLFPARFMLISLYLQWLGISVAGVLCLARRWLLLARPKIVFFVSWGLILAVTTIVSDLGYRLAQLAIDQMFLSGETRYQFVLRNLAISAIVGLMMLRYFWARDQWRNQVTAEGEARYQALHARIRPHFLFNSLNSLAALIPIKPAAAEMMVEDLADLFRVSLDTRHRLVPLHEELDLVRKYLRIEQTGLGARLGADWDVPESLMNAQIPLLTIQPLVENAVYHGVAKVAGAATIAVRAQDNGRHMLIDVENPLPPDDEPGHTGSRTAVENIAQRLRLIYGEGATLALDRSEGVFRARLRLPIVDAGKSGYQA